MFISNEQMEANERYIKSELNCLSREAGMYMPNEIFEDLSKRLDSFRYEATAYSFYYLYAYMWRYAKYGKSNFDVKKIKKMLGIHENLKSVDFIIKKGGILDELGYTEPTFDYPIRSFWADNRFHLEMLSDLVKEAPEHSPNFRTRQKFPIKGFHRTGDREKLDGTFYKLQNTHFLHPSTFVRCMSNPDELGVKAFYIAGLISSRYWDFEDGKLYEWYISREKLAQLLKTTTNTLHKYTDAMEKYEVIHITHRDYKRNEECLANGYSIVDLRKSK